MLVPDMGSDWRIAPRGRKVISSVEEDMMMMVVVGWFGWLLACLLLGAAILCI